jgi:ABC-type transport system involved in cytochrome c biogenesis permease subunit
MATDVSARSMTREAYGEGADSAAWVVAADRISARILAALASLFVMGILIILVGTLAQVDKDMWQVIDEYFRSWIARVDFQVFLPRTWFPNLQNVPYGLWFPGGALIGTVMVVNLLAAHLVRFKTQASRTSLITGTLVLLAGAVLTWQVIASGHNRLGLQGHPSFSWTTLWLIVRLAMAGVSGAALYKAVATRLRFPDRTFETGMYAVSGVVLALTTLWTFVATDNAYLGDAGMRILWQLIQATLCGLVLLAGCVLVFRKRAGIVLIHAGIGLLMFGQFYVSKYDVEEQMRLEEGQTRSYAEDNRHIELAVVDRSNASEEQVVVVPRHILQASLTRGQTSVFARRPPEVDAQGIIRNRELPFDIQVLEYHRNADVRDAAPDEKNLANTGFGKRYVAVPLKPAAGADSGGRVDLAALYVRLLKKDGGGELGTFLLSQLASIQDISDQVTIGDKSYDVSLRFRRSYKPYQITLVDVRKDDYVGTSTPRNYSSDVRLVDNRRSVDREVHIWMNNPLRYAGETFYQSGYTGPPDSAVEATTLSVVTNAGWMIPYVACMIVIVGLAYHFTGTLVRFLRRPEAGNTLLKWSLYSPTGIGLFAAGLALLHKLSRRSPAAATARPKAGHTSKGKAENPPAATYSPELEPITVRQALAALFPLIVVTPFALALLATLWPDRAKPGEADLRAFAKLPVVAEGRVKPFDTLARNSLRVISNRESFRDENRKSQPAIRWLLDVICKPEDAERHQVIRIDNLEVLDTLKLKRRQGNLYSIAEIRPGVVEFERQVGQAQRDAKELGAEKLTVYQRKLIELDRRIRAYTRVAAAFQPPSFPPLNDTQDMERFRESFVAFIRSIRGIQPPLAVPVRGDQTAHQQSGDWQSYAEAMAFAQVLAEPSPELKALNAIFVAYAKNDSPEFNEQVQRYRELLSRDRPASLATNSFASRNVERVFGSFYAFEEFFNHVSPFFFCWFPYLGAVVLAGLSWLVWRQPLWRAAWWLAAFAFSVHTVALVARIYISGRPPVTNLYSSAVFIGWGIVLFCLCWELLTRNGLPTFLGGLLGFATLVVAHQLAGDGDTFTVLQAVLDTQFWLATHVVLITLGYATTFLAGGIGMAYILRGLLTPTLTPAASREMGRMVYGTICFALFFSFFGTVLGGLWADDSWGRFWGWDPKENGALIIVLWNALVLHARWDGMVKERGMAVLSLGGNIVTSWSWFGVNELGVGLHSYGFTEGVLLSLGLFWLTQFAVIVPGCLPKSWWWSFRANAGSSPQPVPVVKPA